MKKGVLLILLALAFILSNCKPLEVIIGADTGQYNEIVVEEGGVNSPASNIKWSPNQVVVRVTAKRDSLMRAYKVIDTQGCSCGDDTLELWTIDTDLLDIEQAVRNLSSREGDEDIEGERQFTITLPTIAGFQTLNVQAELDGLVVPQNTGDAVNIAVIDTGIDYSRDLEAGPFLYNSAEIPGVCYDSRSGWNFINSSPHVIDDHGHGTYVTKLITSVLDEKLRSYRILPLKVFNNEGKGSYWDVVCAMNYIRDINEKGANINIVNASFGGGPLTLGALQERALLNSIISDVQDEALVITSAGNKGMDTESIDQAHVPSGYTADNILAVGGYQVISDAIKIHPDSNFGGESIDVAAPFRDYSVIVKSAIVGGREEDEAILSGTSYATAYITARAADFYIEHGISNPLTLKTNFLGTATVSSGLENKVVENRAILRD